MNDLMTGINRNRLEFKVCDHLTVIDPDCSINRNRLEFKENKNRLDVEPREEY